MLNVIKEITKKHLKTPN